MRSLLIDFLVEVHLAFKLAPQTLFLTINILDRYCSRRVIYKRHYQLVCCSALLVAAKYVEARQRVPYVRELKCMCSSQYKQEMFIDTEWQILNALNWDIGHPTVDIWLQLARPPDHEVEHMTLYLAEIAMYHREFVSTKPSVMAIAALALARSILGRPQLATSHNDHASMAILRLSQNLGFPPHTLVKKYRPREVSGVADILEKFLKAQEFTNGPTNNLLSSLPGAQSFEQTLDGVPCISRLHENMVTFYTASSFVSVGTPANRLS